LAPILNKDCLVHNVVDDVHAAFVIHFTPSNLPCLAFTFVPTNGSLLTANIEQVAVVIGIPTAAVPPISRHSIAEPFFGLIARRMLS
jgi:hypothetical protein